MAVEAIPLTRGQHWLDLYRRLRDDPLGTFTAAAREYGDRVRLGIGPRELLLLSSPDDIEQVLVMQNRKFHKGRGLTFTSRVLGNGLLTSEGEFWRRQRRLAQPAFHRQRIAAMAHTMVDYAERHTGTWRDGEVRDIAEDMMRLTFAIAARTLFGVDVEDEADTVREVLTLAMRHTNRRIRALVRVPPWVPTPANRRFERAAARLDHVVLRIIQARREDPNAHDDLLGLLMGARDEDGSGLSDRQLRDESMTLLLAGHETTANALTWAWYLLDRHPAARAALEAEVDQVLEGRRPTPEDAGRLTYANAVVSEALRLYPPAWIIGRRAVEPFTLGPHTFPAGTQVLMSQWVVHRDPRFYDRPDQFLPERWLDGRTKGLPPFAYFPFGGGPRLCIGKPFALMEAVLVLAVTASRFRLELVEGHPVEPEPLITLRPRYGLKMTVRRR
jgi:cytochrome P450